jgi:hypothetical protein
MPLSSHAIQVLIVAFAAIVIALYHPVNSDPIPEILWVCLKNLTMSRPCVRMFVSTVMPIEDIGRFKAVHFCRDGYHQIAIGNGYVMLLTAVLFCKMTEIDHINGDHIAVAIRTFRTTGGITVWCNASFPFTDGVYSGSCFSPWTIPICADFNMSTVAGTFRFPIAVTLRRRRFSSDTVIMNMRGGGAFAPPGQFTGRHWRPPCSFCTDVQKQFKTTIVYSMDLTNPCVNVSLRNGAVFGGFNVVDALESLVWAQNVVLARSSFARTTLYLSRRTFMHSRATQIVSTVTETCFSIASSSVVITGIAGHPKSTGICSLLMVERTGQQLPINWPFC